MTLPLFERKWRALPRFQQTHGALRILVLWVANAYQSGFKGAHRDPLIGPGTVPLDDSLFRSAGPVKSHPEMDQFLHEGAKFTSQPGLKRGCA